MKCIKHLQTSNITRVSDSIAASKVSTTEPEYEYCSKELWKSEVRDAKKKNTPQGSKKKKS